MPRRRTTVPQNIAWGLQYGALLALFFSLFVGLLALWRGADWNPTYKVSTWSVVLGYWIAGIFGGLLVGVLRPLATGRFGNTLVGVLIGAFGYSAVMLVVDGISEFRPIPAVLAGILVGGGVGFWIGGEVR